MRSMLLKTSVSCKHYNTIHHAIRLNEWSSPFSGQTNLLLLGLLLLLQGGVDRTDNSTAGEGDVGEELTEVLVVADGQGDGAGGDALLAGGGLGGELQKLSSQVLEDSGGVDGSSTSDTAGEAALAEEGSDATDGEDQSSLGGLVSSLLGGLLGLGRTLGGGHIFEVL